MEENKKLDRYLKDRMLYSRAYENAKTYTSSDGNATKMMYIKDMDPDKVKYMRVKSINQENGLVFDTTQFEIILPNGESTIVTVDINGNSMSCNFIDMEGKSQSFLLTPEQQNKIMSKALDTGVEGKVDVELLKESLYPATQEAMEKAIEDDELIPKSAEETVEKVKSVDPNADITAIKEEEKNKDEKSKENKDSKTEDEEEKEEDEKEINLPDNVRNKLEEILEKEGGSLKHVLITKNPQSVSEQLDGPTGIQENGGPVYCLSLRSGDANLKDRFVAIQDERVIDDRKNDAAGSQFMNQYKNSNVVENVKDDETKIVYTDIDGQTHTAKMSASPVDLSYSQKQKLEDQLVEIDSMEQSIRSSSDSIDDKIKMLLALNEKRMNILSENGIENTISNEMKSDIEDLEKAKELTEEAQNAHENGDGETEQDALDDAAAAANIDAPEPNGNHDHEEDDDIYPSFPTERGERKNPYFDN